jgi:hypothetical protein
LRILIILFSLIMFSVSAFSNELTFPIENGTVYVGGKSYSKQVFINQNNKQHQLSNFANWENISSLYVSPNKKFLIVYHKADKERSYRITLYDIEKRALLADARPGMACYDIQWFNNKILFITGTSGSGTIVYVYDYNLEKMFSISDYRLFIDVEDGTCFSYPGLSIENGLFTEYDLASGIELTTFDFKTEVNGDYICESISKIGKKTYQLVLLMYEMNKKIKVIKTFDE